VLGTFYRKSTPDAPPLVEVGARVEVGQTICVLEVMKTYHEVTANAAGTLTEFLVEDGEFVEYGQAIARIAV
jgi:biotin carboxyl carrier protein